MRLGSDLALALDPARIMTAAGIEPDQWQAEFLRSDAREALLLCCRQSGKSTVAAALGVHTALYTPGSLVLLFSPGMRQSGELFGKIKATARRVTDDIPDAESAVRLELGNGSRVVSLPGTAETVRGFSAPALVVIDEAAWCDDDLYAAIRPMLAVGKGRLVLVSTPHGRRGFFHEAWAEGGASWHRVKITADDCPRITPEFLARERETLGERTFRQEYLCEFVDVDEQVFSSELARDALTQAVRPLELDWGW